MLLFFIWDERCRFEDCCVVEQGALVLGACRFFGWLVGCKWCGWRLGRFVQLAGLRKGEREREVGGGVSKIERRGGSFMHGVNMVRIRAGHIR